MAEYTVVVPDLDGSAFSAGAVASSDTFDNDGNTILYVSNGSGGEITITFTVQKTTIDGLTMANQTATLADSAAAVYGPFNPAWFNDSSGEVTVGYSATSSVTAEAIRVS